MAQRSRWIDGLPHDSTHKKKYKNGSKETGLIPIHPEKGRGYVDTSVFFNGHTTGSHAVLSEH